MLKAGLVGIGHLGKIHLRLLKESTEYDFIGFYDVDQESAKKVAEEFQVKAFDTLDALLSEIAVLNIVTPTSFHHVVAKQALLAGKHVFIEKPVTNTLEEVSELIVLAKKNNCKVQVGHVERFNPAFIAAKGSLNAPMFIESHRLAEFNPRGTDVSVVLDLMIHDLDVILSVVNSPVKEIRSSGVSIMSQTPDVANARIVFENGCVANVSTSRISMKNMRKIRFFQKDAYVSVDFLEKKAEVIRMKEAPSSPSELDFILENAEGQKKQILFDYPEVASNNAILEELNSLAKAIKEDSREVVNLEDAKKALDLALQIVANF